MKSTYQRLLSLLLAVLLLTATVVLTGCGLITPQNIIEILETLDSESEAPETTPWDSESDLPPETAYESLPESETQPESESSPDTQALLDESGTYTSKEDVALYLHLYHHLPSNYVTKAKAKAKNWIGGSLESYFPGYSIGGDKYGNYEKRLPRKKGRVYYECDIDTKGKKSRGAKRIVYSNDGLIYYTEDHYQTFTLLYGENTK